MELNFGKYKAKTIQEVFEIDQNYCKWLINQEMLLSNKPEIKTYLTEKLKDADLSYKMRWGKHRNLTLNKIKEIDPIYIDWLKNNQYVIENCPKLISELEALK